MREILSSQSEITDFLGADPLLSASIRLTKQCNLKCRHCYANAGQKYDNELSLEEIQALIKGISDLGAFRLFLTGGEPFLRNDILQIINYADTNGVASYISTNGNAINLETLRELQSSNLKLFQVSIDGEEMPPTPDPVCILPNRDHGPLCVCRECPAVCEHVRVRLCKILGK